MIASEHLKKAAQLLIVLWLFIRVLSYQPYTENQHSQSLSVQWEHDFSDDSIKLQFSSDHLLFYDIDVGHDHALLIFNSIGKIENNRLLFEIQALSPVFDYDPSTLCAVYTFDLSQYPYLYLISCPEYRHHELQFRKKTKGSLFGKTVAIDPGHGAYDDSGQWIYDPGVMLEDLIESSINLEIALKLKQMLQDEGASVYLTRDREYCPYSLRLKQRFSYVNDLKPDVFLSIHQNASEYSYPEGIFIYCKQAESMNLATTIFNVMGEITGLKLNHIFISSLLTLQSVQTQQAVLIECAFLSNKNDQEKLRQSEFLTLIASGIHQGLIQYFANP